MWCHRTGGTTEVEGGGVFMTKPSTKYAPASILLTRYFLAR